jgi:hypothetical protein
MNKIVLFGGNLNERGTSVATYDYAYYLREYLNFEPIIVYDENSNENIPDSISRFEKEFKLIGYNNFNEIQNIIDSNKADYFYWLKYGRNDNMIPNNTKTLFHSVFVSNPEEKHGDVYAVISEWMSSQYNYQLPYVPHMINLPSHNQNIRDEIGIPNSHIVIGRTGGYDSFNISFAYDVIEKVLQKRNDIWFVLMNTPNKLTHERCIYIDRNVDLNDKVTYINTCDAMLHARIDGETFGLSVLEFASKNKQIISYDDEFYRDYENKFLYKYHRNHLLYLKDNCHKYQNENDLENILLNIKRDNPFNTNYLNEMFSPQNVIQKFSEVFLSP